MIQKILDRDNVWVTFHQILKELSNNHHSQSLLIELEMKEMCGKIVVDWENEKVKNR